MINKLMPLSSGAASSQYWEQRRLKYLVRFVGGATPSTEDLTFWNGEIPWVSPKDMKVSNISDAEDHLTEIGLASCSSQRVAPGNVLVVVRSGILRHTLPVAINTCDVALNQDMKALIPRNGIIAGFLRYFLLADHPTRLDVIRKQGATVESIDQAQLSNLVISFPNVNEQEAIVKFLDHETAEADALIEKYERLMELLEEKRVALITQVVTKGLDPSVPMKDSGVEWIGYVPTHWEILPVRRITKSVQTGGTPPETDFYSDGLPWYTPGDFKLEIDLVDTERHVSLKTESVRIYPKGSVLLVGIGATLGNVGLPSSDSSSNQQCNAIIPRDNVNSRFLAYALVACHDEMRSRASASTLPILNQSKTKGLELPIPAQIEQEELAGWIDKQLVKIGALTERARRAIILVKEHRSALITVAVTGQIDVSTYRAKKQSVEVLVS